MEKKLWLIAPWERFTSYYREVTRIGSHIVCEFTGQILEVHASEFLFEGTEAEAKEAATEKSAELIEGKLARLDDDIRASRLEGASQVAIFKLMDEKDRISAEKPKAKEFSSIW